MMQVKNNILLLLSCIFCIAVAAQDFSVEARLDTISKTGFYELVITPELSSHVEADFRDLRIADAKEKFVPYIIRTTSASFSTQNYSRLPIVSNEIADSGRTVLILQNNTQQKISSLALLLRNAAVTRTAIISGSDNMNQWFAIDEDIYFQKAFVTDSDRYVQTIRFPASSYKYLKLVIDNRKNNPLNIIEAGVYADNIVTKSQPYTENPAPHFFQTDSSDNITYLSVKQEAAYHIDRIRIAIKAPHFYKRDVDVITSKGSTSFELISGKEPFFDLPAFDDSSFLIKIYNGDNPALQIEAVITQQVNKSIVTYLESGKRYTLRMHNSSAIKPVYDLRQFSDSIPATIPKLNVLAFEKINAATVKTGGFFSSKWIWPVIIIMIAVLAFFTVRLTREVNKRNDQ